MKYSPPKNNIRPFALCILFTVIAVFCMFFSQYLGKYTWIGQLAFVCFATVAIQILIKYVLTQYEYICEEGFLFINKCVGRKKFMVGKIDLSDSESYLITNDEFKTNKDSYNFNHTYFYTRNLFTRDIYAYVIVLPGEKSLIKIECNDDFAEYVNKEIDKAMKGR